VYKLLKALPQVEAVEQANGHDEQEGEQGGTDQLIVQDLFRYGLERFGWQNLVQEHVPVVA
jgi:hypothetical protein